MHQPGFAIVTGASSGIGRAIADRLQAEGQRVLVVDRNPRQEAEAFVRCDLADVAQIDTLTATWRAVPPAQLVNCAGVTDGSGLELVLRVNFLAARRLTEAFLHHGLRGGRVVQIASGMGMGWRARADQLARIVDLPDDDVIDAASTFLAPELSPYALSKQLLCCYSSSAAARGVASEQQVNVVMPGPITTPLLPDFRASMGRDVLDWAEAALGRLGSAEEVAEAVRFMLSDRARWINGAELLVDGGLMAVAGGTNEGKKAAAAASVRLGS